MLKFFFPATLVILAVIFLGGCSDGGGPTSVSDDGNWWGYYLDDSNNPITLPSGFKLVKLDSTEINTSLWTSSTSGFLDFVIDPNFRSNAGWLFRGNDQGVVGKADLTGAVEFIKQSGYLRLRETFDWDSEHFRYTQFPIRLPFAGFSTDLMLTLLSEPYIAYPTDESRTWNGDPVYVSDGSGQEIQEIMNYHIEYVGTANLMENNSVIQTFDDVILIKGLANKGTSQGRGEIDCYLAPNVGIIYYYLTTAFGQPAAGALVGFSGENVSITGSPITDYFPTAPGNHWNYEFAPDDHVAEFRFNVQAVE